MYQNFKIWVRLTVCFMHLLDLEYVLALLAHIVIGLVPGRQCGQFGTGEPRQGMEIHSIRGDRHHPYGQARKAQDPILGHGAYAVDMKQRNIEQRNISLRRVWDLDLLYCIQYRAGVAAQSKKKGEIGLERTYESAALFSQVVGEGAR
jgi:hypothetical protein